MAGTLSVISTVKNGIFMVPEASLLHPASFLKQPTSRTTDTSASLCPHALSLPTSSGPVAASEPTHFNKNFAKRTSKHKSTNSTLISGGSKPANKTQKLNLEVSPHRAVSAVRLMRVELGGAFADLLNENGKGSGYDEMRYVENTLGFRTRALDDRDKRLVTDIVGGTIRWRRYLDYVILSLCNNADTFTSMEPLLLQAPKEIHLKAVYRILHYLKGNPGRGILFKRGQAMTLEAYTDSDYAGSLDDRRSTSGYCLYLGGNLIIWRSKKQPVVARSSVEAEFRSMALGVCELLWVKIVLEDLKIQWQKPMKLYCDNKSAISIAHDPVQHDRTKHVEVDQHFIKEKIDCGLICTPFVPSKRQLADILTKGFTGKDFQDVLSKLGMVDPHSPA